MSTYTRNQNHRVFDFFNCMEEKDRYWFPRPDVYIFQGQDYLHCCRVDKNFPGRQSKLCRISAKHILVPRCFQDMNWVYSCRFFFKKGVHTHPVAFCIFFSGVSRPSEKGRRGGLKKNCFQLFGPQFGLKIRGGGRPHGPLPWIYHCSCYSLGSVNLQLHVRIRVWDPLLFSNALYCQNSLHELSQCAQVLCDIVHQHQHMRLQADGMKFSSSNTD